MDRFKIARRLRQLRGDRSRLEVCKAVKIGLSALSMYENAERIPRDEVKIRFANYFGCSVETIFFWLTTSQNVKKEDENERFIVNEY